ncbi:MAG: sensor histidine kinase, partial [Microbacterium sp.]
MIRSVPRRWLMLDIVGAAFGFLVTTPLSYVLGTTTLSAWIASEWIAGTIFAFVSLLMWGAAAIARLSPAIALAIAWA